MNSISRPGPATPNARSDDDLSAAHRLHFLVMGLVAAGVALGCALAPQAAARFLPWPLPPLHARCLGALWAAAALPWLLAVRQRDLAAVRIVLALSLVASLAGLLQSAARWSELAPRQAAGWIWLAVQAVAAVHAGRLLLGDRLLHARAERLDRSLAAWGLLMLAAASGLALAPDLAARVWPWPLPRAAAVLYASAGAAWGAALCMLAAERRRAGRRLALWGLTLMGPAVAAASIWHRSAFHHPALAVAWVAAFLGLATLCARRLRGLRIGPAR